MDMRWTGGLCSAEATGATRLNLVETNDAESPRLMNWTMTFEESIVVVSYVVLEG